jgi:hypothetical protein
MREDQLRVIREYERETVDQVTGETQKIEHIKEMLLPREPDFIKLYLRDVMYLQDLPAGLSSVMYQLLTYMDYENLIPVNAGNKRIIAKRTGQAFNTVNNAISKLVKGRMLYRIDTGIYRVNPYLFGKGQWNGIHKIRMEISYGLEGRTIKSVIEDENGKEIQSDSESR